MGHEEDHYDARQAWHFLSRIEAYVMMDHNLAKASASRQPGNKMRAEALRRSRALDIMPCACFTAAPVR